MLRPGLGLKEPGLFGRFKNIVVLVAVLIAQLLGLAIQVKRPDRGNVSLLQVWAVAAITPIEKGIVHSGGWVHQAWHDYFYLRSVREENERLLNENTHLRLDQVRLVEDASQAQRLQALLKFKEQFISETLAAQVVGTSGSEQSRVIYIDKGWSDGVRPDMAVITPTGIVGKVIRTFASTSQVLEINDQSSGVGAILDKSRLQGIVKGASNGETTLNYIMADEKVEAGEMALTSGGDRIFPKGLPIGRVMSAAPGRDTFLRIVLKPSANLSRIEEVLIITKVAEQQPDLVPENPRRAADILAERLPTITVKPPDQTGTQALGQPGTAAAGPPNGTTSSNSSTAPVVKPANGTAPKTNSPGNIPSKPTATPTAGQAPGTTARPKQTVAPTAKPPGNAGSLPAKPATNKPVVRPSGQNAAPPVKDTTH